MINIFPLSITCPSTTSPLFTSQETFLSFLYTSFVFILYDTISHFDVSILNCLISSSSERMRGDEHIILIKFPSFSTDELESDTSESKEKNLLQSLHLNLCVFFLPIPRF